MVILQLEISEQKMRKLLICLAVLATLALSGCKRHEIKHFDCNKIGFCYDGFSDINIREDDGELYNAFWDDLGIAVQKIEYEDLDSNSNFMKILNDKTQQIALAQHINITNQTINQLENKTLTGIFTSGNGDGKGIMWIFGVAEPKNEDSNFCLFFVISYTENTKLEANDVLLKSLEIIKN